jgi:TonB family protein
LEISLMEIMHLSLTPPASEAAPEVSIESGIDGIPGFALVPTTRLPVRRLLQGLAAEVILFLAALALVWLLPTTGRQEAERRSEASLYKHVRIFLQNPPPARKRPHEVQLSGPRIAAIRKFSPPPATGKTAVSPRLEPEPTVAEKRPEPNPQMLDQGIPVPPTPAPAPARLEVSPKSLKAPKTLPSLDADPLRASVASQRGNRPGGDPLGSVDGTGRPLGGVGEKAGGGPPNLSPGPDRRRDGERRQERIAFTKPQISFMPKPSYPPNALAAGIEGDVSVEVTFDKNGQIIFRRFVRSLENAELNAAARETVERIKFVPAIRNGVAEDQESVVTVFFRLTRLSMNAVF